MAQRKFDSARLYKLLKWAVIVLTILLGIMFYLQSEADRNYSLLYLKEAEECSKIENRDDAKFCYESRDIYLDLAHEADQTATRALYIAILLPIFFFGGRLIYKYVFPVKA